MNRTIGDFLQLIRKEKGMTQKELAEKINVSDKTVSKWENGNSTPDTMILIPLCEVLGITVNELLCGERILSEEYSKKAEENIVNLLQVNQQQKKAFRFQYILGGLLAGLAMFLNFGLIKINVIIFFDAASLFLPICLSMAVTLLSGKRNLRDVVSGMKSTIVPSGAISLTVGMIAVLTNMADAEVLGPKLAICLLTLVDIAIVYLVLYVVEQHMDAA